MTKDELFARLYELRAAFRYEMKTSPVYFSLKSALEAVDAELPENPKKSDLQRAVDCLECAAAAFQVNLQSWLHTELSEPELDELYLLRNAAEDMVARERCGTRPSSWETNPLLGAWGPLSMTFRNANPRGRDLVRLREFCQTYNVPVSK